MRDKQAEGPSVVPYVALVVFVTAAFAGIARGQMSEARYLASHYQENAYLRYSSIHVGASGLPTQIEWSKGPLYGVLSGTAQLFLVSPGGVHPVPPLRETQPGEWVEYWKEQHLGLAVQYRREPAANITFTIQNLTPDARTVQLELVWPMIPEADRAFFPAASDPKVELQFGKPELVYSYGTRQGYNYGPSGGIDMALPLASVYAAKQDWGLALLGDERTPIPGIMFKVARSERKTTVRVLFPNIKLGRSEKAVRRIYLVPTAGDWRPCLAAALALFPQVFEPKNPDIPELRGPFMTSAGTPPDDVIAEWAAQGTRAVEIHGVAPFYGRYVPGRQPYVPFSDDVWHFLKQSLPRYELLPRPQEASWREIRNCVETYVQPTMSRARIRDYIARLHRYDMRGFLYLNPTEAWAPWAAAEFPDDRRLGPGGRPVRTWFESVEMHPDKNRAWGKYILNQLRGELEIFPQVNGIFFDQSAEGGDDLYELCAKGCRMVRVQGKVCWWNGPYNAELASLADGMMTEGGWRPTYRKLTNIIQYYGLAGKPVVSLGSPNPEAYSELLLHGVTPKPVPPDDNELAERWFPLFGWLRQRRWVLQAHALKTDPRVASNIFEVPGGNYVIPLVVGHGEKSTAVPRSAFNVQVRVSDVSDVKSAFLLTPDHPGYRKLLFHRSRESITIPVPSLEIAGLLILSKSDTLADSYFRF